MTFEETKSHKLQRMTGLRIMNALGMVAWRSDEYGEAIQKLRLLHPLTWTWVLLMVVYGTFAQGVPETIEDVLYSLKYDTVWI
jgi:hypothetical protein